MIITRYFIKEILTTLGGVLVVLLLIAYSAQLVGLFSKVAAGTIQADTVATLFGLYSLTLVPMVLPMALYLAIVLALSRLYMASEMTALEACGYASRQLLRPVWIVALLLSLVQAGFVFWFAPWAEAQGERLERLSQKSLSIEGITPGQFRSLPEGRGVIYVERINEDRTRIENVFVEVWLDGHLTVLAAESGHVEVAAEGGDRYLVLENGTRYEGRPGAEDFAVIHFRRHGLHLRPPKERGLHFPQPAIPTPVLWEQRHRPVEYAELQWRISAVLLCLALATLAVPLSRTAPRHGRYGRLVLAVFFYLVFNNLLNIGRSWLVDGTVPRPLGLWWMHALVVLLAFAFIGWQGGGLRRLLRRGS